MRNIKTNWYQYVYTHLCIYVWHHVCCQL